MEMSASILLSVVTHQHQREPFSSVIFLRKAAD